MESFVAGAGLGLVIHLATLNALKWPLSSSTCSAIEIRWAQSARWPGSGSASWFWYFASNEGLREEEGAGEGAGGERQEAGAERDEANMYFQNDIDPQPFVPKTV